MNAENPDTVATSAERLAELYLQDLERSLAGAEPQEREETLAEIREQLQESAAADPEGTGVRREIERLGPVESIAAVASPARVKAENHAAPAPPRDWFVMGTAILSGVALVTAILYFPFAVIIALVTFILGIIQLFISRMGRLLPVLSIVMSFLVLAIAALIVIAIVAWNSGGVDESGEVQVDSGVIEEPADGP